MLSHQNPRTQFVKAVGPGSAFAKLTCGLSEAQKPYVIDPEGIVTNHAARRAGKSRANAVRLLRKAHRHPGGLSFFAAKTAGTAKRILWTTLRELNHEHNLGLKFDVGELTVTAPNGYQLWLLGLKDDGEADKLRGAVHGFVDGVIDECATIPEETLKYAALECALPALGENAGSLALSGTPGALMQGFFYEQCRDRHTYHWDARQNPFLKQPGDRFLAKALRDNPGWHWGHPTFQREYLGLWVEDRNMLVYPYEQTRNLIYPGQEFASGRTILGVDVGYEDGNGFTVSRSQPPNNPEIHVLCSYERQHQILPKLAAEIETLQRHYSVNYTFVDEGNNGKMVAESLRAMGVNCQPTPKGLKRPRIEVVRGALAAGTMKVLKGMCDTLIGEWGIQVWNAKLSDVDERYSNECSDSCIYSALSHRGFYEALLNEPLLGSREHTNREQNDDKRREELESITAADLAKTEAHLQRARGVVLDMRNPRPVLTGLIQVPMASRRRY